MVPWRGRNKQIIISEQRTKIILTFWKEKQMRAGKRGKEMMKRWIEERGGGRLSEVEEEDE